MMLIAALAALLGLGFNALRAERLPLVAPFPYRQDCPDKIPDATMLRTTEVTRMLGDKTVLLIDARPAVDYEIGHLEGAVSLPYSIVKPIGPSDLCGMRRYRAVVIYCDSPEQAVSRLLAKQLEAAGLRPSLIKVVGGDVSALMRAAAGNKTRTGRSR